jgi:cob(I)alamin adenosyltransferase
MNALMVGSHNRSPIQRSSEGQESAKIDPALEAVATIRQLQAALRAADQRLERGYTERERLKKQLDSAQSKLHRIKSWIPFGHQISAWASQRKIVRGGKS